MWTLHAVAVAQPDLVCAVGDGSVMRSTDAGQTWTALNTPFIAAIFQDVDFVDDTFGAAAASCCGPHSGVFLTNDGGLTWTHSLGGGLFAVDFVDPAHGWATANGVVRTVDGGATWIPVFIPGLDNTLLSVSFVDQQIGWVAGERGFMARSTDGGVTWQLQDLMLPPPPLGLPAANMVTAVHAVSAQEAWCTTARDTIHHTLDAGQTWTHVATVPDFGQLGGPWGVESIDVAPNGRPYAAGRLGVILAGPPGAPPCPADIDDDGIIGITDFLALLGAWGSNPGHPADLDGDGMVGILDLLQLLADWGPCF